MPSIEHDNSIETIKREIESRGLEWKTKKNVEVFIPEDNSFGLIDICGYRQEEPNSPAEVECYEIEHSDNSPNFIHPQSKKNKRKLEIIKKSFPSNVKVFACQLSSFDNHLFKCKTPEPNINQQSLSIQSIKQNVTQKPLTPITYKQAVYSQPKKQDKPTISNKFSNRLIQNRVETTQGTKIIARKRWRR